MGLKRIAKQIAQTVTSPFVKIFYVIFSPVGRRLLARAADAAFKTPLGSLVLAVVEEVENIRRGETGMEKHAAAIQKIIDQATQLKLEWKESLVNLLIELAVQRLKGTI